MAAHGRFQVRGSGPWNVAALGQRLPDLRPLLAEFQRVWRNAAFSERSDNLVEDLFKCTNERLRAAAAAGPKK